MSSVISDGNGGVTLKRSLAEKIVLGLVGAIITLGVGLGTFICGLAYREMASFHDGQIKTNAFIEASTKQTEANSEAIKDLAEALTVFNDRISDLRVQVATGQREASGQSREITRKLADVKETVEDKIPEPKKR